MPLTAPRWTGCGVRPRERLEREWTYWHKSGGFLVLGGHAWDRHITTGGGLLPLRNLKEGMNMQLPTIHMNGTGKQALIDQLTAASDALETAFQAMKQAAPNGRDYYPQGAVAMERAEAEHRDRMTRLDMIKAEVDAMACALSEME